MLTKGAIGNLVNRYRAVLKKCRLMNIFGSLAAAGLLFTAFPAVSPAQGSLVNGTHSFTDDTAVEADQLTEGSVRTGIIADSGVMTVTVSDGKTLAVSSTAQASDSRTYGAATQAGASLAMSGDADFTLKSESQNQQARIFRANGGNIDINGTISGSASSKNGMVVGAEVWDGATLSFSGKELSIDLQSETGRIIGVQNHSSAGAVCNFDSEKTVISITVSSDEGSAPEGIYSYQSTTNFTGNTEISVHGGYLTSGMFVQCDPGNQYDTVINFSGDNTVINVTGPGETYAVTVSGVPGSINFTGKTAEIHATSSDDMALGVVGQYGSQLTATADVTITAEAAQEAFGIQLTEYGGPDDYYAGNADFDGDLSVTATSADAEAFGVYNSTVYAASGHTEDGKLSVAGDCVISATADNSNAYGVYTAGGYAENSFEGDTEIQSAAPEGESFGILAEGSSGISVGSGESSTKITATGAAATAAAASGSSISIGGATAEIAATADESYAYGLLIQDGSELDATADTAVTAEAAGDAFGVALLAKDVADTAAGNADFDGDLSVTAKSSGSDAYGVYDPAADAASESAGGRLDVAGDSTVSAESEKGDAYGIYAIGENAENSLNGNVDIQASAPEGESIGVLADSSSGITMGSDGCSVKIAATGAAATAVSASGSSISITGATAEIAATAAESNAYGLLIQAGSELDVTADTAVTAEAAGDAIGVALLAKDAADTASGNADFDGSLTVNAKSSGSDAYGVYNPAGDGASESAGGRLDVAGDSTVLAESETGDAYGIYAIGENAENSLNGNVDIQASAPEGASFGVLAESSSGISMGSDGSSTKISATGAAATAVSASGSNINIAGATAEISATAGENDAYGLLARDGAGLYVTADTSVTAEAAGDAFGVALLANDADTASGNADFDGSLSVTAKSSGSDAYGVYSPAADGASESAGGRLNVTGDSSISAEAEKGDAYGIYTAGGNAENSLSGNVDIQASAPEGKSFGIYAEDSAGITMGSEGSSIKVTATGADSTAIALEGSSSLSVTGTTTLEAGKALAGTGSLTSSGSLTVVSGTVDTFTGTYTQTSGSTVLADDSNFFGGDVIIKKGMLTAGDVDTSVAGGADSVLGLGRSIEVQTGKNLLIGTDSGTGVVFGSGSALVVDGRAAGLQAMIKGSGALTVEDGSRLYITNAKADTSYYITEGLAIDDNAIWTEASLQTNRFITVKLSRDGNSFLVKTDMRDISSVMPGVIPESALRTMIARNLNDTDAASMGTRFLSRATEPLYMSDNGRAVSSINEVSRAAVTAGVQNTSLRLADAAAGTVLKHLSLAGFDAEHSIHKDGMDVWAVPMYGNTCTHDMSTSVYGNYGGLAIGADVHLGTLAGGSVRAGIAVNGGGGRSETRDNVTSTENSYNFGGVSLYAGWNLDNLNIMASLGYNAGRHEIEMSLPASLGMGTAEADVYTRAFTADLRAEYLFKTSFLDIMPHAGVRYTALYTDDYDLEVNGSRLNSAESDMQNIVQFPVGVTFSRDIEASGWTVRPQLDLSVIPAVGGLRAESEVCWSGINAADSVSTRIMDTVSYAGTLGIQAESGNFAIGLNYGIQAARHETNHSLNAGFTWKF